MCVNSTCSMLCLVATGPAVQGMRPRSAPNRAVQSWKTSTARVMTSVATTLDAQKTRKQRSKPRGHHRQVGAKQRPFRLTSGKPDAWNPRVDSFLQDAAASHDRCALAFFSSRQPGGSSRRSSYNEGI